MIRSGFVRVIAVVTIGLAGAGLAAISGSSAGAAVSASPSSPGPSAGAAPAGLPPDTGAIGAGPAVRLTPAQASAAADRCAAWASQAGFANSGYAGGALTTAVAVALAESGCDPAACLNDTTHAACTPSGSQPARDSIDRGVWQVNSKAWPDVSNACAYRALCNARAAYRISAYGTYFGPWTTYLLDRFAGFMWVAQQAVNELRRGTITSALTGSCVARSATAAELADCGSGAARQQWRLSGEQLRSGGRCLAAAGSGAGPVLVEACGSSRLQDWQPGADATLHNVGARQCLADPGASLTPGTALTDGSCAAAQDNAWFEP